LAVYFHRKHRLKFSSRIPQAASFILLISENQLVIAQFSVVIGNAEQLKQQ
jgi:hypothetical protein